MVENTEPPLVVVPDANVLIHGKSLADLPWAELDRAWIEVVLVPPMIQELDKLKTERGRPNKIARQLISDIRKLLSLPDKQTELRKSGPAVTKRVESTSFTDVLNAALKLDHADQALINYALHLKLAGADVLFLTDDTICGITAESVGLAVLHMPDHWQRPPEPDEVGKQNARLKAEVQRLSSAEPMIALRFGQTADNPATTLETSIVRWPALSEAEIDDLVAAVCACCPEATSFERPKPAWPNPTAEAIEKLSQMSPFAPRTVYEPATEEEIEDYKAHAYPDWLKEIRETLRNLHLDLNSRIEWPTVMAVAGNVGTRPAEGTLVRVKTQGGFVIQHEQLIDADDDDVDPKPDEKKKSRIELPLPPSPPRGRIKTINQFVGAAARMAGLHYLGLDDGIVRGRAEYLPFPLPKLPSPRDPDEFYWRSGRRGWVKAMELDCENWRHGSGELRIEIELRLEEVEDASGAIELSVHANNMSAIPVERLPIRIGFEDGETMEEARALVEMLGRAARGRGLL